MFWPLKLARDSTYSERDDNTSPELIGRVERLTCGILLKLLWSCLHTDNIVLDICRLLIPLTDEQSSRYCPLLAVPR